MLALILPGAGFAGAGSDPETLPKIARHDTESPTSISVGPIRDNEAAQAITLPVEGRENACSGDK